jgi:hypothetical protein
MRCPRDIGEAVCTVQPFIEAALHSAATKLAKGGFGWNLCDDMGQPPVMRFPKNGAAPIPNILTASSAGLCAKPTISLNFDSLIDMGQPPHLLTPLDTITEVIGRADGPIGVRSRDSPWPGGLSRSEIIPQELQCCTTKG